MDKYDDQEYLAEDQYADSSNLNDRIALHVRFSTGERDLFPWVFDQFDLPADAAVLELGCGPGYLWRDNTERIPDGWTITLSDLSSGMVADARATLRDVPHDFDFQTLDAQELPFEAGSFDAVIANHMLYHVPDREQAYAEIRRILAPGGHLYATTNGRDHMRELFELVDEFEPGAAVRPDHVNDFRLESGGDELREHFEHVELRRYDSGLRIPEVEPLVAYVGSGLTAEEIDIDEFREFVRDRLEDGPLDVTKDTGMFVARKE